MRKLWRFHGGLKLEGHKALSMQAPIIQAPIPHTLTLPLQQHIGEPAQPIVEIGERVLTGQYALTNLDDGLGRLTNVLLQR